MRRPKRQPLRGSVTQNTARVRVRPKEMTAFSFMMRLGLLVGSVMLILGLAAWLWHIGWPQRQAEHLGQAGLHMTQKAHFAVKDVIVEGRQQTGKEALSAALGIGADAPILSFDPIAAQARIAKLPWVASVTVERLLPDTVYVRLVERQPLARWQHEGRIVVIDAQGNPLPDANTDQFSALPLVVGADAAPGAKTLLDALGDFPAISEKMTAAVWVGGRRWDLHLDPQVTARLPETGLQSALKLLSTLITQKNILERDIAAIDLRLPDRLIIESAHPVSSHPGGDQRL
jgi:cell division protein FtsQ